MLDNNRRDMDMIRTLEDCERAPRPVVALASDHPDGEHIEPHSHPRAQLIHTLGGVMTVTSREGSWIVPPGRAVWMPPHEAHAIRIAGDVSMRTVFVRQDVRSSLPRTCEVIEVSPFLREAIVTATSIPLEYAPGSRDERVMELILDEIEGAPRLHLHVDMPRDARLLRLCERVIADPSMPCTLERLAAEINVSARTLARMFHRELGMSFGQWLRRTRLLLSMPRLAAGTSVLEVALEHGYDSPSAFAAMFRRTLGVAPTVYLSRQRD
ncbi:MULTISPECIES: helix-turn-helix transcriptional regulator [unclassified Novosphingobium]|uniref:AraC family transcriptional regulator n=2 Tax=Novosphingobium TaxID=165696 RepID=UPI0018509028|nr:MULTISPECIES: helix-turn-helix transcriptional regulator [unclassified Novosphingobium]MBB3554547.1 AraC-like DNA-binding protein [Novosphingobium sp. BK349]MBB3356936.1 AraC-like DNA-binding protein [Novosphingobium sp. BK256]MBB3373337.1 AraC-like DNA-binding protein [Novosphingobium sp. BK280]MBB3377706.1 AraC-like DNA-binding protein [Novosphingobium sp. BK258]MBB3418883.1 AraC-like DNA-binding protein [Novosphingobium sp. BK267]